MYRDAGKVVRSEPAHCNKKSFSHGLKKAAKKRQRRIPLAIDWSANAKRSDGRFHAPDCDPAQRSDGVPSKAMASPIPIPNCGLAKRRHSPNPRPPVLAGSEERKV